VVVVVVNGLDESVPYLGKIAKGQSVLLPLIAYFHFSSLNDLGISFGLALLVPILLKHFTVVSQSSPLLASVECWSGLVLLYLIISFPPVEWEPDRSNYPSTSPQKGSLAYL